MRRKKTYALIVLAVAAFAVVGCVASAVDGATAARADAGVQHDAKQRAAQEAAGMERKMAGALDVGRVSFEKTEILMRKSMPPQFDLLLTRQMPTPGWSFDVDEVRVEAATRRIVARVSERRPNGIMAQVMTDTTCRVPLGALEPGAWVFELWLARPGHEHAPVHAMVLTAR